MPVLSKRIVLDCFYLLIFYSEKFSTDVCRLPYAVNVNLNLSNVIHRDNVPYNIRQWGHWLARNVISTKQNLGLGLNGKSR